MRIRVEDFNPIEPCGFLVLDGVNGAGKSTQLARLVQYVTEQGHPIVGTREPGGTELGSTIRQIFMQGADTRIAPLTETFLFAADRAQHVAELIKPALGQGKAVVTDRYYYSTLAFQGYGRTLDVETLRTINEIAIDGTRPDLVFLFDLDPAAGLARTSKRQTLEQDAFESEELAFHGRLRGGFLDLSQRLPEPFVLVDASRSESEVWQQMQPFVDIWLAALHKRSR